MKMYFVRLGWLRGCGNHAHASAARTHKRSAQAWRIFFSSLAEVRATTDSPPSCDCASFSTSFHGRTPSGRKENPLKTHSHTLGSHLFWFPWPPPTPPAGATLPSPTSSCSPLVHFSSLLAAVVSVLLRGSDVLFGGFRPDSGLRPAASGPLLHPGPPAAAVSHGRDQLPAGGPSGKLRLVLWWTWRRGSTGE